MLMNLGEGSMGVICTILTTLNLKLFQIVFLNYSNDKLEKGIDRTNVAKR